MDDGVILSMDGCDVKVWVNAGATLFRILNKDNEVLFEGTEEECHEWIGGEAGEAILRFLMDQI